MCAYTTVYRNILCSTKFILCKCVHHPVPQHAPFYTDLLDNLRPFIYLKFNANQCQTGSSVVHILETVTL